MCGIFGVAGNGLDKYNLERATNTLNHRGPDDSGSFFDCDKIFLGHKRLSVIDLSPLGKQPMSNDKENLWITYNGEIYNFRELRNSLEAKGYRFKTQTDTEVILKLYEERGESCVNELNGMFAFTIYDKDEQKLFIARDRLGVKPLYYSDYNGYFLFASEIKAILSTNIVKKEIDWQSIYDYFSFLYVPFPDTSFKNIKQIPPAHYLVYDLQKNKLILTKYWDPCKAENKKSFTNDYDSLKQELKSLLESSLSSQLVSDVPLGVFLSGGIDSSILASLAAQYSKNKLKTYTVTFKDNGMELYDESSNAKKISNFLETDHTEIDIKMPSQDEVFNVIDCFDQPFGNPTSYLYKLISKYTKKYVTVVLSGTGGDELFGGYPRYKALQLSNVLRACPEFIGKSLSGLFELLPESNNSSLPRRMKLLLRGVGVDLPEQYLRWTYYFSDEEKKSLLTPMIFNNSQNGKSVKVIDQYLAQYSDIKDLVNRIQYVDLKTFLVDNVLEYTDKTSMAVGLETRVPFLDHRLVEFALKLPSKYKINGGGSKVILKDTFSSMLPAEIFNAPKKGFCPPISSWMDRYFDPYFDSSLTFDYVKNQGIMNWDYIQQLRYYHKSKKRDNSMELFGIIMFDVWYRKYFN